MTRADLDSFVTDREQSHPDQPVVIAADKTVKYEAVMNVMSDLKARGVKRVGLLVKSQLSERIPPAHSSHRVNAAPGERLRSRW